MAFSRVPGSTFEGYPSAVSHTVQVSATETRQVITVFARLTGEASGGPLGYRQLSMSASGVITWYGDDWHSLGGRCLSDPVALQPIARPITAGEPPQLVFVRGPGNKLRAAWSDGAGWTGIDNIGIEFTSDLSVVDSRRGVHVFLRGLDNQLHAFFGEPSGSTLHMEHITLGGLFDGNPRAIADTLGQINVFVRGRDNQLWRNWSDESGWHGFHQLSGTPNDHPYFGDPVPVAVELSGFRGVVAPAGSVIFMQEEARTGVSYCRLAFDGRYQWMNGASGGLPGALTYPPAGAARAPTSIDVFARSGAGFLLHSTKSLFGVILGSPAAEPFPHWTDTGDGPFSGRPCVVAVNGRIHVFVRGGDHGLWHEVI